jgi:TatA/E family protein of Tat protein translocase
VFNIGPEELLLILLIALIVFGPKRLPEIGRTIGKALREFRRASEGVREEVRRHLDMDGEDDGFTGTFPVDATASRPADGDAGAAASLPTPASAPATEVTPPHPEDGSLPEAGSGPAA